MEHSGWRLAYLAPLHFAAVSKAPPWYLQSSMDYRVKNHWLYISLSLFVPNSTISSRLKICLFYTVLCNWFPQRHSKAIWFCKGVKILFSLYKIACFTKKKKNSSRVTFTLKRRIPDIIVRLIIRTSLHINQLHVLKHKQKYGSVNQ